MDEKEKEILLLAGKLAISAQKILNSNLENFSENIINLKESLEKYNDTIIMLSNEEYQTKPVLCFCLQYFRCSFGSWSLIPILWNLAFTNDCCRCNEL